MIEKNRSSGVAERAWSRRNYGDTVAAKDSPSDDPPSPVVRVNRLHRLRSRVSRFTSCWLRRPSIGNRLVARKGEGSSSRGTQPVSGVRSTPSLTILRWEWNEGEQRNKNDEDDASSFWCFKFCLFLSRLVNFSHGCSRREEKQGHVIWFLCGSRFSRQSRVDCLSTRV